jgi:SAM-dependent methyltransferase
MTDLLGTYDAEFPGFLDYFQRLLEGYFRVGPLTHPKVAQRMEESLRQLGPEVCRLALAQFAETGIFQADRLSTDAQVQAFWTSPLMAVYRAAIGYAPEAADDLVGRIPSPVATVEELFARQLAYRDTPLTSVRDGEEMRYWSAVLQVNAPELYLWPFLRGRSSPHGLDLGCGWGRGALGLRDYSDLTVTGVDINEDELALLRSLAANAGLSERVKARLADITSLPFTEDTFDFALSYVVLDLLSDHALGCALREVLRCLKPGSPFYVDIPTDRFCGAMMLQRQCRRGFIELLHGIEAHGKVFQLAFHDPRLPMQYTFAVLGRDEIEVPVGARRPTALKARTAARLKGELSQAVGWRERLRARKSSTVQ